MHAEMRRMPAERARHAKRLGHVQSGSGPVIPILAGNGNRDATTTPTTSNPKDTTTTPAQSTSPTSPAAVQTSSSALSSALTLIPSSSASPSTAGALTSSAASFTSPQFLPTSTPSSSLVYQHSLTSVVVVPTSSTPSSTSTPQTVAAAASSSGLSGGAIAGIIAAGIIAGVALIVFFVRKTYLRRRERKHISWTGAPVLGSGNMFDEPKPIPEFNDKPPSIIGVGSGPQRGPPVSPFEAHGQSMYTTPSPLAMHPQNPYVSYAAPAPPQATYNNPVPIPSYSPQPAHSTLSSGNTAALAMARVATGMGSPSPMPPRGQQAPVEAAVKCTFVPTLPDELSITTGERIRIVAKYDDGWALCANGRGEQGMVPRECLELAVADQPETDWMNARRVSSVNPGGRRF
ncbi:hypothetical protein BS17DRAFT_399833 [Gyrodon lividus]|nr:hypothetical protein BS17DRAFT_399833 [Gyrodon lividus]